MINYIGSGTLDNKIVVTATKGDISTHINASALTALKTIGWDSSVILIFNLNFKSINLKFLNKLD